MKVHLLALALLASAWPQVALAADEASANAWIRKGAELFKHEDYEGARAAFGRAYALEPRPATLFNLALSEVNSDHPVEAAAHLRTYLISSGEPASKLESARTKWLPRAESRTARLEVFAPAGAELAVDGVVQAPPPGAPVPPGAPAAEIVIAAGEHDVTARQGTASEAQHVTARRGEVVELHFQRVPDAPAPPAVLRWAPGAEAHDRAEGAPVRAKWLTVAALGAGAVAAAAVGVAFGAAAQRTGSEAQVVRGELAPASASAGAPCASASGGLCAELRSDVGANRQDWALSAAAYAGAAVLGAAALATWTLWKPHGASVAARPAVGARGAGMVIGGQW